MKKKKSNKNENLLKLSLEELKQRLDNIGDLEKRLDFLGDVLAEFYGVLVNKAVSSKIMIQNAQTDINALFDYFKVNNHASEVELGKYRETYRGLLREFLGKAMNKRQIIVRGARRKESKSLDYSSCEGLGVSVVSGVNVAVQDAQYKF